MHRTLAALVFLLPLNALAAASVTIYGNSENGDGYAWVNEERVLELKKPTTTLTLENLPREVEPDSVKLSPVDEGDFRVTSQQFRFDLVNQGALFTRFLGQNVAVERVVGDSIKREEGLLMSEAPLMIKKPDGSVLSFQQYDAVHFPKLPEGLALEPSLQATLSSAKTGKVPATLLYQTRGLGWWMDYSLKLSGATGELSATLHATNNSGRDFTDAALSVMAGNIQPPQQAPRPKAMMRSGGVMAEMAMDAGGVSQQAVGDVHRYDVPGKATLPNSTTTELPFFAKKVSLPVEKRYRFRGGNNYGGGYYLDRQFGLEQRTEVESRLLFTNSEKHGLGMPLPDGRLRVFAAGPNKVDFIGETRLNRLSPEEKAELPLGTAFDITARREQESFESDQARKTIRETIKITLTNRSTEDVTVDAEEALYRSPNAQVIEKTMDFERIDANTIRFPVKVKAGGEATVRYTVKYTWQ